MRHCGMSKSHQPVAGEGILPRMIMWKACEKAFYLFNRKDGTEILISPADAMDHHQFNTAQFGENAEREVIALRNRLNPRPMMDDSGDFKRGEQNA